MDTLRSILEDIKKFDDIRRVREDDPPEDEMLLSPPAPADEIAKLLDGGWSQQLPKSYGVLLAASNGVTKFRGKLDFLSTDSERQEELRTIIQQKIDQDDINLRAMFKKVDAEAIQKLESDPDNLYVANHPVIAATEMGGLLFYDSRTRRADGEMDLCWRSSWQARIEDRYPNLESFLQAAREEAREEAEG